MQRAILVSALVFAAASCDDSTPGSTDDAGITDLAADQAMPMPDLTIADLTMPPSPDAGPADLSSPADSSGPADAGVGCHQNSDCQANEFCNWTPQHACGRDGSAGFCETFAHQFCPSLGFWICACDGNTYTNECFSHARGLAVDYGGPCRNGPVVPCTTSADCPVDPEFFQYCIDDPRDKCVPADGGVGCPGVCANATYVCSPTLPCLSQNSISLIQSPGTEACVAILDCTDPQCNPGRCVDTTGATCQTPNDCKSGELCVPLFGCDPSAGSCPGVCVRP